MDISDLLKNRVAYDKKRNADLRSLKVKQCRDRRHMLRDWLNDLKSTMICSRCPETHVSCLQFHHLGDKTIEVSSMIGRGYSKERILIEIQKCVVLCGNCHAKLHHEGKSK